MENPEKTQEAATAAVTKNRICGDSTVAIAAPALHRDFEFSNRNGDPLHVVCGREQFAKDLRCTLHGFPDAAHVLNVEHHRTIIFCAGNAPKLDEIMFSFKMSCLSCLAPQSQNNRGTDIGVLRKPSQCAV